MKKCVQEKERNDCGEHKMKQNLNQNGTKRNTIQKRPKNEQRQKIVILDTNSKLKTFKVFPKFANVQLILLAHFLRNHATRAFAANSNF